MKRLVNFARVQRAARLALTQISTLALPHLCLHCQKPAPLANHPALCEECKDIHWRKSRCTRCGHPCHPDEVARPRCYRCKHIQLPFQSINSCGPYRAWLREAILQYKYTNDPLAKRYLIRCWQPLFEQLEKDNCVISFIPSHKKRLKERRSYQQHIYELLRELSSNSKNITLLPLLEKHKFEKAQVHLTGDDRRKAVEGTFSYIGPEPAPERVHLFDDVWTTGSTLREAARVLQSVGIKEISLHVLAWTSNPDHNG